jgi:NDP-sugar pyrophosphorylase family protein
VVAQLAAAGVERVVINVHHLPESYGDDVLAALPLPVRVVVEEGTIRGTAGGVAGARQLLGDGPVLVANGDILAEIDLDALRKLHQQSGAEATLAVRAGMPIGEGTLGLGRDGRIVRLREGRYGDELEGAEFVGTQLLAPALLAGLPDEGCLVADVYMPALAAGRDLRAAPVATSFSDIGTPASYLEANMAWLRARAATSFLAGEAQMAAGTRLEHSIVGAGAQIDGEGGIHRCVLWPRARARAPLSDSVVTSRGRVVTVAPERIP